MDYSAKQLEIIQTTFPNVIVISAASSGKTTIITARISYLLDVGIPPEDIVAITFTNLAAEELRNRLGARAANCFIGTIHSYCNKLLTSSGIDTSKIVEEEKFDTLFTLIKKHPECIKDVEYLFLDEAQDSNENQFNFILDMVRPENIMFVGDPKQSIYRFNDARPEILMALSHESNFKVYDLNENYRNSLSILNFAKDIIKHAGYDYIDNSKAMRKEEGAVISVEFSPKGIAKSLVQEKELSNWFILCRKNSQVDLMSSVLTKFGVNNVTIRRKDFSTLNELRNKLNENNVKIMTVHAAKGLEADNVIVVGCNFIKGYQYKTSEAIENICINYVAATRAKNKLVWTYKTYHHKTTAVNWE